MGNRARLFLLMSPVAGVRSNVPRVTKTSFEPSDGFFVITEEMRAEMIGLEKRSQTCCTFSVAERNQADQEQRLRGSERKPQSNIGRAFDSESRGIHGRKLRGGIALTSGRRIRRVVRIDCELPPADSKNYRTANRSTFSFTACRNSVPTSATNVAYRVMATRPRTED
jgi:hypothetical protein